MAAIPKDPQARIPPQETQSFWNGARLPFRYRRRMALMVLATSLTVIALLYSYNHLHETYLYPLSQPQACQSLDPQKLCVPEVQVDSPPLTVAITQTSPSKTDTVIVEPPVEPVVFSLVMVSEESAKEGTILLKSAIMYTSRPLHFHIICDEAAQTFLEIRFRLLTHPIHSISVRFYRLSSQSMLDRVSREGSISTGHRSGPAGLMRLFMHELLPDDVEKAIFVDTDAFFLADPALLWEEFSDWDSSVSVSMPYHPNSPQIQWFNGATTICSCIMLLHFGKFRAQRLMDSSIYRADHSGLFPSALSPPTFEALFGPLGPDDQYDAGSAAMGDQSYWWAIVSNRTELFRPLRYDWGVTSCELNMFMTGLGHDDISEEEESVTMQSLVGTPYEGQVVLPKILHFNCQGDIFYLWEGWSNPENGLTGRWKAAVDYHVGFKWLWLNRRDNSTTLDIQTIIEPLFADQRFAAEHTNEDRSARD